MKVFFFNIQWYTHFFALHYPDWFSILPLWQAFLCFSGCFNSSLSSFNVARSFNYICLWNAMIMAQFDCFGVLRAYADLTRSLFARNSCGSAAVVVKVLFKWSWAEFEPFAQPQMAICACAKIPPLTFISPTEASIKPLQWNWNHLVSDNTAVCCQIGQTVCAVQRLKTRLLIAANSPTHPFPLIIWSTAAQRADLVFITFWLSG